MTARTFALTFAAAIQIHLQPVLGMTCMEMQDQIAPFYWVRLGSGVLARTCRSRCSARSR